MRRLLVAASLLGIALFYCFIPRAESAPPKHNPELISQAFRYDDTPSITVDKAGTPWCAWVGWNKDGDQVLCAHREAEGWSKPFEVSQKPGNYIRPAIVCAGDRLVIVWTATTEVKTSLWMAIHESHEGREGHEGHGGQEGHEAGEWSKPERVSPEDGYHLNAELCVGPAGKLWMVWQAQLGKQYQILLAGWDGKAWGPPVTVCDEAGNNWDPAVVADSKGRLSIAYSSFRDADYDIFLRTVTDGKLSAERRLTDHAGYDLHPCLAVDAQDRVWAAWDRVVLPKHGGSGGTTITGTEVKGAEHGGRPASHAVVRCIDGDSLLWIPPGPPDLPRGYAYMHCGYPRIAFDSGGALWLVHRALMSEAIAGRKRARGPFSRIYWWDVIAYRLEGKQWSEPIPLEKSDGYLEEASLCASKDGVWVAHQMEHRTSWMEEKKDGHEGFNQALGVNGDIYVTRLDPSAGGAAPAPVPAPKLSEEPSELSKRLHPREAAQYQVEHDGTTYHLLYGDLHKHSDISRCSVGTEPSLEDHYRYSHDVCQYDWLMMSDHSQHTTDFAWWKLQKTADLYYIPGWFAPMIGYEASLSFPSGHSNIVFPGRPAPIIRPNVDGARSEEAIYKALAGTKALVIPHTTADPRMGTDWSQFNPEFTRVVEMFQACRGSYEYDGCPRQHHDATNKKGFVQVALAKGYRLGFECSSDHGYGVSYAEVYAKGNTREDIFEALYNRRCYGSTAYGIVLDVSADGHLMGQEYQSKEPAKLSIYARAYTDIRQVEVFSEGKVVQAWGGLKQPLGKPEVKLEWQDGPRQGTQYYYVRVILADDEIAWGSPIWVDYAK